MTSDRSVPPGLVGLDPAWSRVVHAPDGDGIDRRWHVLDNLAQLRERGEDVAGTVLCVHGNPTWSYLWRRVLAHASPGWRVVAPDHLGMGYSQRTRHPRRLAQRVEDLAMLTAALELDGPVVLLAHDWGGPIGLGWALRHTDVLHGVVLTNTAVHQPAGSPAPAAIRVARSPGLLDLVCRRTPAFVRATTATARPALPAPVRQGFAAPYDTPARRRAVADFVADIPLDPGHPSAASLQAVANGLGALAGIRSLLVWGPGDPVFSQRYLEDLIGRLPHADVHRYEGASHLVLEDRPEGVGLIWDWVTREQPAPTPVAKDHADAEDSAVPIEVDTSRPGATAIVELTPEGSAITFAHLAARVGAVTRGLAARGVRPGDRVAVLVPPGIDLTTLVYAVWQLGAVVVVADAGLGLRRLGSALRGAGPDHVVGIRRALALTRATRVPGARIRFEPGDVAALIAEGAAHELPAHRPDPDDDGAVLFTSGATGPPKGVVYTRRGLGAQVALLRDTFGLSSGQSFVAAFAPFALYGPALGMTSAVPDMEVTAPHTLTAAALSDAIQEVRATIVFASPAALRNVVATAAQLTPRQRGPLGMPRLVLSAGAPVPVSLLQRVKQVLPSAATHTPYGMTEALPVATIDPTEAVGAGLEGVCVGAPLPGVQVRLDLLSEPQAELSQQPGVLGEILVRGPHVKDRYDRLWGTQEASSRPAGWHRTGDVGQFDAQGRLWVQGRLAHVMETADGPVPPYGIEQRVESLPDLQAAAAVGVGPAGTQQIVVIVVPRRRLSRRTSPLAGAELAARVRAAAAVPVAAVLQRDWLPVDIRHASKVDRAALAQWATRWLHGRAAARELTGRTGRAPVTRSR